MPRIVYVLCLVLRLLLSATCPVLCVAPCIASRCVLCVWCLVLRRVALHVVLCCLVLCFVLRCLVFSAMFAVVSYCVPRVCVIVGRGAVGQSHVCRQAGRQTDKRKGSQRDRRTDRRTGADRETRHRIGLVHPYLCDMDRGASSGCTPSRDTCYRPKVWPITSSLSCT